MIYKRKNFYGFRWEFPGGAESSYYHIARKIQDDPRLSRKRKIELINDIQCLCGHIISDIDEQINQKYDDAYFSGIKYMCWKFPEDRPGWFIRTFFADVLRRVRMNTCLSDKKCVYWTRNNIAETARIMMEKNK